MEKKVQNFRPKIQNLNSKNFEDSDKTVRISKDLGLGIIHLKDGIIFEEKADGTKQVIGALKPKENKHQ